MAEGYKIFPRSKAYRDNFEQTFGKKKDVATFENCVFTGRQTIDVAMAQLFGGCRGGGTKTNVLEKPTSREIKGITE